MATRSAIIQKQEDGTFRGIYCHWDGYPSNNGKILLDHYSDPEKLKRLIDLGYISQLAPEVEPTGPHSYSAPQEGVTVAYHRDRGEKMYEAHTASTSALVAKEIDHSYCYVYADGVWYVDDEPLAEVLKKECE